MEDSVWIPRVINVLTLDPANLGGNATSKLQSYKRLVIITNQFITYVNSKVSEERERGEEKMQDDNNVIPPARKHYIFWKFFVCKLVRHVREMNKMVFLDQEEQDYRNDLTVQLIDLDSGAAVTNILGDDEDERRDRIVLQPEHSTMDWHLFFELEDLERCDFGDIDAGRVLRLIERNIRNLLSKWISDSGYSQYCASDDELDNNDAKLQVSNTLNEYLLRWLKVYGNFIQHAISVSNDPTSFEHLSPEECLKYIEQEDEQAGEYDDYLLHVTILSISKLNHNDNYDKLLLSKWINVFNKLFLTDRKKTRRWFLKDYEELASTDLESPDFGLAAESDSGRAVYVVQCLYYPTINQIYEAYHDATHAIAKVLNSSELDKKEGAHEAFHRYYVPSYTQFKAHYRKRDSDKVAKYYIAGYYDVYLKIVDKIQKFNDSHSNEENGDCINIRPVASTVNRSVVENMGKYKTCKLEIRDMETADFEHWLWGSSNRIITTCPFPRADALKEAELDRFTPKQVYKIYLHCIFDNVQYFDRAQCLKYELGQEEENWIALACKLIFYFHEKYQKNAHEHIWDKVCYMCYDPDGKDDLKLPREFPNDKFIPDNASWLRLYDVRRELESLKKRSCENPDDAMETKLRIDQLKGEISRVLDYGGI